MSKYKKLQPQKMKELQCLFAWSDFYRDTTGHVDSKGEPLSRMRYRSDNYEKYQKIQDQISEFNNNNK